MMERLDRCIYHINTWENYEWNNMLLILWREEMWWTDINLVSERGIESLHATSNNNPSWEKSLDSSDPVIRVSLFKESRSYYITRFFWTQPFCLASEEIYRVWSHYMVWWPALNYKTYAMLPSTGFNTLASSIIYYMNYMSNVSKLLFTVLHAEVHVYVLKIRLMFTCLPGVIVINCL